MAHVRSDQQGACEAERKLCLFCIQLCLLIFFSKFIKPELCRSMLDQWATGCKGIDNGLHQITSAPSRLGPKK